uniref:Uncharacterized protein n=1 Tax=Vespula pensylvanica TaxID=30213 RepID=A0A834MX30_VESPE|nr:hypothetical protein H0235_018447 [Vespula pensylvanica]
MEEFRFSKKKNINRILSSDSDSDVDKCSNCDSDFVTNAIEQTLQKLIIEKNMKNDNAEKTTIKCIKWTELYGHQKSFSFTATSSLFINNELIDLFSGRKNSIYEVRSHYGTKYKNRLNIDELSTSQQLSRKLKAVGIFAYKCGIDRSDQLIITIRKEISTNIIQPSFTPKQHNIAIRKNASKGSIRGTHCSDQPQFNVITAFMLCVEKSDKAALESSLTAAYKTLDSIVVYSESVEMVAVTLTSVTDYDHERNRT